MKQLKSELAALDRKIQLELAPKHNETPDKGQEQGGGQDLPKTENVPERGYDANEYIRNHIENRKTGVSEQKGSRVMKI